MKTIGSFLIIISSIIASHYYERQQKIKIESLKDFKKFIQHIKHQIEYFSYPLDVIYEKYKKISENTLLLITEPTFDSELNKEISFCFSKLGKGYKSEQIKNLEYLQSKIDENLKLYESKFNEKISVFRAISLFVGCCTAILLV